MKKEIGRCKDCVWREERLKGNMVCENPHLTEYLYRDDSVSKEDCLFYSYDEGGWFEPGDNFGCIHFKEKSL